MTTDFAIIGNAIMGYSLAWFLKKHQPDATITVIGPEDRKAAATTAAGAMIAVYGEMCLNQFENRALCERVNISLSALPLWDGFCADLSNHCESELKVNWGSYLLTNARGDSFEDSTMAYIIDKAETLRQSVAEIPPQDIDWFAPSENALAKKIIEIPDGRINPNSVLDALNTGLLSQQVDITNDKVKKVRLADTGGDHTLYLEHSSEPISAKNIVFANGTFAQSLIDEIPEICKNVPRILWGGGAAISVTFEDWVKKMGGLDPNIFKMDKVIRTLDRGGACGIHVVPRVDGSYYVGATSGVWMDYEEKPRIAGIGYLTHQISEEISRAFFFANMSLIGPGYRPTTADTFPLIGETEIPGVWFSNGFKRDGFTCSPYISNELAKKMLGLKNTLPNCFKPMRPLISYKTKDEAIEDAVKNLMSGDVSHGLRLPAYRVKSFEEFRRKEVEKVYEDRKIEKFGIHPELVHIYQNDAFFNKIDIKREFK